MTSRDHRHDRSATPSYIPKNVREAAGIFRTGEDAELAYRLQNKEYVDIQQYNEQERKLVSDDIRVAKRAQSAEEDIARQNGYIPAYVRKQLAEKDYQVADDLQNQEVKNFVQLKEKEKEGERVAEELFQDEQEQFIIRERQAREQQAIAKRDEEAAKRFQQEEYDQFQKAEDLARQTQRDADFARKLAMEEERRQKPVKYQSDEHLAAKLSESEKRRHRRERDESDKDRDLAKVIMEKDFRRYNKLHGPDKKRSIDGLDLLAIQQIEIDRGNYNSGPNKLTPPRRQPEQKSKSTGHDVRQKKTEAPRRRSDEKHDERNRRHHRKDERKRHEKKPQKSHKAENVSKEFRTPKGQYKSPAQYQSRPGQAVAYFPEPQRQGDSDGGLSTESFGEFYNPKDNNPIRRVRSFESILDTESVCADDTGMTVRIKPGVYQKTPAVQLAEREHARQKQHRKDVRREQRARNPVHQKQQPKRPNYKPVHQPQKSYNHQSNELDVHQMLYGRAPARKPKKKQSSDCSMM